MLRQHSSSPTTLWQKPIVQTGPFYKISPTLSSCSNNLIFLPRFTLLKTILIVLFNGSTTKEMPGEHNSQVLAALEQDSCLYTPKTAL